MTIELSDEILKDTIAACQEAYISTQDTKFLAIFSYWLNQQSAGKYRQETIHENKNKDNVGR